MKVFASITGNAESRASLRLALPGTLCRRCALTEIALLFDRQFAQADLGKPVAVGLLARAAVWLVIALVALNVVSTLLECGFVACPDNPVSYQLLKTVP